MKYLIIVMSMCCSALAQAVVIDLRDEAIEDLDGTQTLILDFTGISTTISAEGGVTNRTRNGFGINAPGGADDADAIDGDAGPEAISVQFSEPVQLVAIALSGFGRNDIAELVLGELVVPVTQSGIVSSLQNGQVTDKLALRHVGGNGFSLDRIEFAPLATFAPTPAPAIAATAPAPGAAALAVLGFALVIGANGTGVGRRSRV